MTDAPSELPLGYILDTTHTICGCGATYDTFRLYALMRPTTGAKSARVWRPTGAHEQIYDLPFSTFRSVVGTARCPACIETAPRIPMPRPITETRQRSNFDPVPRAEPRKRPALTIDDVSFT